MKKATRLILSLNLITCIFMSVFNANTVSADAEPVMIGYRYRDTFENLDEYPVDHVYYFDGVNEPVGDGAVTYLTVSNAVAVIHDLERQSKEVFSLDEFTVTTTQALNRLMVYKLNENYKMDLIFDEKNVETGSIYTFKDYGIYNLTCNNIPVGSVEVVSADHHSLQQIYPEFVMDNQYNYIPVYSGEQWNRLVRGSVIATPTDSEITVEGNLWNLDAYNINDNNYFKLRDIAFAFTCEGAARPFDVTWDSEKNAINLISNKQYTTVGGECGGYNSETGIMPTTRTAMPTTSEIYVDGVISDFKAYNIGGNNYFKLRDLAQALDFEVNWIPEQNMIYASTSGSYQDETKTDLSYETEDFEDEYVEEEYYEEDYGTRGAGEYLLTFEKNNSGVIEGDAGYYKPGDKIEIRARSNRDFSFMSWSSDCGGEFYNVFKNETTFTMPASDVVVKASYIVDYSNNGTDDSYNSDALDRYDGQNINLNKYVQLNMKMIGCGSYRDLSGPYHPGQVVELSIGAADEGIFMGWSSDDVDLPTPNSPRCKIVIPDHDVTVTATFSE